MFGMRFDILSIFGFKIRIDVSWFFIAILLSWTLAEGYYPIYYPDLSVAEYWAMGITGMLGLFVSVVLHELAHALVARTYALPISGITLFIFGGVAELQREPPSPRAEFMVAVAGPIASLFIAIFFYFITVGGEQLKWSEAILGVTSYLAFINTAIVIFNLLPAFPLDGGRIFRAMLWKWKNSLGWATRITSRIGAAFGLTLMVFGVLFFISGIIIAGVWWFILGMFLRTAALMSNRQFLIRRELGGENVAHFMQKDPITVPAEVSIKTLVDDFFYRHFHQTYPVIAEGEVIGHVSLEQVKKLPQEEWERCQVKELVVPCSAFNTVTSRTSALTALNIMSRMENDHPILLVVEDGVLVGILSIQDLMKLISLKIALEGEL